MWYWYSLWWSSFPRYCSRSRARLFWPRHALGLNSWPLFRCSDRSWSQCSVQGKKYNKHWISRLISSFWSLISLPQIFQNVHNGKKQFIKTIGFTSNEGLQLAVTPTTVEIYENGKPFITYDLENDKVEERMFDIKIVIKPADHETRHNRHTGMH